MYHIALADEVVKSEEKKVIELTGKMLMIAKAGMDVLRTLAPMISS